MRLVSILFLVWMSCNSAAETVDADDDAVDQARLLFQLFHSKPKYLHEQLEVHYLAGSFDDQWSPDAVASLSDWFQGGDQSGVIVADCVADMCIVDFFVSYKEFLSKHGEKARQWELAEPEGFLPEAFYFANPDGSIRYFVFRDTFYLSTL
jgi:hypothetical protein